MRTTKPSMDERCPSQGVEVLTLNAQGYQRTYSGCGDFDATDTLVSLKLLAYTLTVLIRKQYITPKVHQQYEHMLAHVRRVLSEKAQQKAKKKRQRVRQAYRRTTYADLEPYIRFRIDDEDDEPHWLWTGEVSNETGEPVYRHEGHSRDEAVARILYRDHYGLKRGQRLFRWCRREECVAPHHHATIDRLPRLYRVELVLRPHIRRIRKDGRTHWLWKKTTNAKPEPMVTIDGKNYRAVPWAFRTIYPDDYHRKLRLFRTCSYSSCIHPLCWSYRTTKYAHLYRPVGLKPGFSACWIGKRKPDAKGYVRYRNRRLHRVVYEEYTGELLPSAMELHHLCGPKTRACCNPKHLQPMTKHDHYALHAQLKSAAA
jgi:HNH endonuclease